MAPDFEIDPHSVIADVLREYPECIDVFDRHNMPCRTCMGVSTDTIEEGALMHDVDLDRLIAELRDCCNDPEARAG